MLHYVVAVVATDTKDDPDTSKEFLWENTLFLGSCLGTETYDKSSALDICFLQANCCLGLVVPS